MKPFVSFEICLTWVWGWWWWRWWWWRSTECWKIRAKWDNITPLQILIFVGLFEGLTDTVHVRCSVSGPGLHFLPSGGGGLIRCVSSRCLIFSAIYTTVPAAVLLHLGYYGMAFSILWPGLPVFLQQLTASLLAVAFLTSFGSSMLYGYNLAVVNSPAGVRLEF